MNKICKMMKEKINELAVRYKSQIIDFRKHLHTHPELSFKEFETCAFVEKQLRSFGKDQIENKAGTGLVALIEGKNLGKKVIAIRADMDALPIKEENAVLYKPQTEGVMHACGHDVHTSSLLGAALILNEVREEFEGTIKLFFQPGEEIIPGGASLMIKDKALENPSPSAIIGQHVMPLIPVGKVGFKKG